MLDIVGQIVFGFFKYGAILFFSFFGIWLVNDFLDRFNLKVQLIEDVFLWLVKNFIIAILKGLMYAFAACTPLGFIAFLPSLQEILLEYVFVWIALIAFLYGMYETWKKDKNEEL
jgi:hypothetical protein